MTPFDAMVAQDQEDRLPWFYVVPLSRLAGSGMEALVARIEELPYDFPPDTEAVQLSSLLPEKRVQVADMADRVTPICDLDLVDLLRAFLEHKRAKGSSIERELYARMNSDELFTRLLRKRPLSFWGLKDKYVLPSTEGERQLAVAGRGGFEAIGSDDEQAPLLLADYLSYDEMQLSVLISVAVPTLFVNSGHRDSECKVGEPGSFQEAGVMVACVGARLVKGDLMESEHMVIRPGASGGVDSRLAGWAWFYGIDRFPSYAEAAKECTEAATQKRQSRYHCIQESASDAVSYLDGLVYKRRIRATVEPFLVYRRCS